MKKSKKIKIGVGIVIVLIIGLFLHYNLPRTAIVQISGTDIKRMDKAIKDSDKQSQEDALKTLGTVAYDVRFINSVSRNGKTMVFRNEDTGWGWPPYFKFDSADLAAMAQNFANDPKKPWVLVKYYGWRFPVFSWFPNALSLKKVNRDYSHFPLFNIIFIILLIAFVVYVRFKMKKLISRIRHRKE